MTSSRIAIDQLRSQRWFAPDTIRAFAHRQRLQQIGLRREEFMGRPVIAILNTWSEMSPCHSHLRERAQDIKRGILLAGGFPVELPVQSVGEVMVKPTTMLYRNLLAMEVEELLRSLPIDGAVLLGGCDKSTPGLLMGAISMDLPVLFCPAGPMSNGYWRGVKTGAGTHTKKYWDERRLGIIDDSDWRSLESAMTRSIGTCNTVGTASTMTTIADAMGFTLPGASSIPAADGGHPRMASLCGETIVQMVWHDRRPSAWLTPSNFRNGVAVYMAMGGSTNAAIHLIAMAGRAGIPLSLNDLDQAARQIPVLLNLFPSGNALMEDYHFAGGLPALLREITSFLDLDCPSATGTCWRPLVERAECHDPDIIRSLGCPVVPLEKGRTLTVLYGNLCPNGAVMKSSAADPLLRHHIGPALVFDNHEALTRQIDDPDLEITPDTVLVLRNAGPVGAPGMPEWGNLPIPAKLLRQGIKDMVRLTDARMSGTHYGSCILHVSPESAVGGPLGLIQTGDTIELNVEAGSLNVLLSEAELARRRSAWKPRHYRYERSFSALYQQHVTQAHEGCDFDFLQARADVPEPPIY